MLRQVLVVAVAFAVVALATGCGGAKRAPTTAATVPATTTGTLANTVACKEIELDVRFISQLISNTVESMANSLHPKELARRTGVGRQSLLVAARLVERFHPPPSLVHARAQLVQGLRRYAADFGRAQRAVQKNDIAKASRQLSDPAALTQVRKATAAIDRACGA